MWSPSSLRTVTRLVNNGEYKRRACPTRTGIWANAGTNAVVNVAQVTIAADGIDPNTGDFTIGHQYVSMASATPETDLELGYVTTFMDGALALQANAGYQMNVAGLGGSNAVSVISRAKINF